MQPQIKLMLDSGAFSLRNTGETIDLPEYCNFIERNAEWLHSYVNLDHINRKDTNESARRSLENYTYMRGRGLRPIPVFHGGEDIIWLQRMLDLGAEHISVSIKGHSPSSTAAWYDNVWRLCVDNNGLPTVRLHGLGETSRNALMRYPWYSVDSSTWLQFAQRYATGMVPGSISKMGARRDGAKVLNAIDLHLLGAQDEQHLHGVMRAHGLDPAVLQTKDQTCMLAMNIMTALHYMDLGAQVTARCPIKFRVERGLFAQPVATDSVGKPMPELLLFLAAGGNIQWSLPSLAAAGCKNILVSYYDILKTDRWGCLRDYVYNPKDTVAANPIFDKQLAQIKSFAQW
jgi:hypothetical protein